MAIKKYASAALTAGLALALSAGSAFATTARVESMGKTTDYILDDQSIFDNPALVNLYSNYLMGDLGNYVSNADSMTTVGKNHDPLGPWFGGVFSLNFSQTVKGTIGGFLGRTNENLQRFMPDYVRYGAGIGDTVKTPTAATTFDGFLGLGLGGDRYNFGAHVYIAQQDGKADNGAITNKAFSSAFQGDLGAQIRFTNDLMGELSGGFARLQFGPDRRMLFDFDLYSLFGKARVMSALPAIDGNLIFIAQVNSMQTTGFEETFIRGGAGVSTNFSDKRGFFWLGVDYAYVEQKTSGWSNYTANGGYSLYNAANPGSKKDILTTPVLGRISFGIERNIWWDWFVIRVGGQKAISYNKLKVNSANSFLCKQPGSSSCKDGNYFDTNPVGDGTASDLIGFGIGINIEEQLKVDATLAEDLLFRNPFQGEGRLISRISATYSF